MTKTISKLQSGYVIFEGRPSWTHQSGDRAITLELHDPKREIFVRLQSWDDDDRHIDLQTLLGFNPLEAESDYSHGAIYLRKKLRVEITLVEDKDVDKE